MAETLEITIDGSEPPKIVEIDASEIARIIMRKVHAASPTLAAAAANAIVDYLTQAMMNAATRI